MESVKALAECGSGRGPSAEVLLPRSEAST